MKHRLLCKRCIHKRLLMWSSQARIHQQTRSNTSANRSAFTTTADKQRASKGYSRDDCSGSHDSQSRNTKGGENSKKLQCHLCDGNHYMKDCPSITEFRKTISKDHNKTGTANVTTAFTKYPSPRRKRTARSSWTTRPMCLCFDRTCSREFRNG